MKKYWEIIKQYFPLLGLILVIAIFSIATKGAILSKQSLQSLLNSVIATALVSLGAVFVFGSGNFDMSMGGCLAFSAVIGGYAAIASGSLLLALIICLVVSLMLGLLKGIFAAYVEVPLFIVTIVLGFIISAVVLVIMGVNVTIHLNDSVHELRSFSFGEISVINLIILGAYFLLTMVLFDYTKLGREVKILGGNAVTARQTGMNARRIKIVSFLISAIGVGLAAFAILVRVRAVGTTTAGSMGTDVMTALVLGGMPLVGGPRSKISAGLVGAATITVLNAGLTMVGFDLATIQTVRALIFLAVVYVASASYRTNLLPR